MAESKLTAFRCPADLLAAIEAEMEATGDGKTEVMVRRLRTAYGLSEDAPAPSVVNELRAEIEAAIAPILSRLEALELKSDHAPVLPTPKTQDISRSEENAPQLPFVAANHDIPEISPLTMPINADEIEVKGNHPEPPPESITDDLSEGLTQAVLASRYALSRQAVGGAIKRGTVDQWLKKQGADFDGIYWRYDSETKLFFPVKN